MDELELFGSISWSIASNLLFGLAGLLAVGVGWWIRQSKRHRAESAMRDREWLKKRAKEGDYFISPPDPLDAIEGHIDNAITSGYLAGLVVGIGIALLAAMSFSENAVSYLGMTLFMAGWITTVILLYGPLDHIWTWRKLPSGNRFSYGLIGLLLMTIITAAEWFS